MFSLMNHHKWSITEMESLMPWEKQIYVDLLDDWIKQKEQEAKEKAEAELVVDKEVEKEVMPQPDISILSLTPPIFKMNMSYPSTHDENEIPVVYQFTMPKMTLGALREQIRLSNDAKETGKKENGEETTINVKDFRKRYPYGLSIK